MNTEHKLQEGKRARVIPRGRHDKLNIVRTGHHTPKLTDLYVLMLGASWKQLLLAIVTVYMATNVVFACAYLAIGNGIENAREGSFVDAFFFSVQTLSTIGYGKMAPIGIATNLLVTIEVITGFSFFALITGLVFSKFSRPTAHLLFSEIMTISPHNGTPHLKLRLANKRNDRIVDVKVQLTMLRREITEEGHMLNSFHDLALVRNTAPFLQISWTLMHPMDEKSPLYNMTREQLENWDAEFIISISGVDEVLSQNVAARYSYLAGDIRWDAVFVDIMKITGTRIDVNYHLFHDTKPAAAHKAQQAES